MILSKHIHWNAKSNIEFSSEFIRLKAEEAITHTPDFSNFFSHQTSNFFNSGSHGQRKSGSGTDFWQYREYREGDPAHKIDWRKSARSDTAYIRDREWEIAQTIALWLDQSPSMHHVYEAHKLSKYQYAAILAYILSTKFIYAGERLSFLSPTIKSCTSKAGLANIAEILAMDHSATDNYNGINKSFPILLSDFWGEISTVEEQIRGLTSNNYKGLILQIVAAEELSLPYKGRLKVQELNDDENSFTINDLNKAKTIYDERIKDHCHKVQDLAHKYGCAYMRITTDTALSEATLTIYDMLTHGHKGATS